MFDRPAEILEITRKICPRGVQNRKSNKKRACRYADRVHLYNETIKPVKGFDCDKGDSLWLDNLLAKGNQWNCANWFPEDIREIFLETREETLQKLLLFLFMFRILLKFKKYFLSLNFLNDNLK